MLLLPCISAVAGQRDAEMDTCGDVTAKKAPGFVQPHPPTLLQNCCWPLWLLCSHSVSDGDEFLRACLSTVAVQGALMGTCGAATVNRKNPGMSQHTHTRSSKPFKSIRFDDFVHTWTKSSKRIDM